MNYIADNYDGSNNYGSGLGFSAYVGGRWFFTDKVGVYLELGHGISTLNAGIALIINEAPCFYKKGSVAYI